MILSPAQIQRVKSPSPSERSSLQLDAPTTGWPSTEDGGSSPSRMEHGPLHPSWHRRAAHPLVVVCLQYLLFHPGLILGRGCHEVIYPTPLPNSLPALSGMLLKFLLSTTDSRWHLSEGSGFCVKHLSFLGSGVSVGATRILGVGTTVLAGLLLYNSDVSLPEMPLRGSSTSSFPCAVLVICRCVTSEPQV